MATLFEAGRLESLALAGRFFFESLGATFLAVFLDGEIFFFLSIFLVFAPITTAEGGIEPRPEQRSENEND